MSDEKKQGRKERKRTRKQRDICHLYGRITREGRVYLDLET
jgi:hypothetical protein